MIEILHHLIHAYLYMHHLMHVYLYMAFCIEGLYEVMQGFYHQEYLRSPGPRVGIVYKLGAPGVYSKYVYITDILGALHM